jgi:hypothetical protein
METEWRTVWEWTSEPQPEPRTFEPSVGIDVSVRYSGDDSLIESD